MKDTEQGNTEEAKINIVRVYLTYRNGVITATPNRVPIFVEKKDQIRWEMDPDTEEYDIDFGSSSNCPFSFTHGKRHSSNGKLNSGAIAKEDEHDYKYSVIVSDGTSLDPEVSIRRAPF
jgi:hypothetical protein